MTYEVIHEIQNSCPNNQKRDMFFDEVETNDPEGYVRSVLRGTIEELSTEVRRDGVIIHVLCSGLRHRFTFTE